MKSISRIDNTDAKILQLLLRDARTKLTDIAKECELSSTAVKNRIDYMEKSGLIVKPLLNINMIFFGYKIPLLVGVNLEPSQEESIIKFIKSQVKVAGIDRTIGKYDLCLFVFAENITELDELKYLIRKQKGVTNIEINIWDRFHFNFDNIQFTKKEEI